MNEREELLALHEWMREPDWAENFSLEDMANWINRRPTHTTARLIAPAQAPMDREKVAKIFAYIWHGDLGEWQGFLSKADAFLTYPVPSTNRVCAKCGCETRGEEALVNDEIWCHPCADGCAYSSTERGRCIHELDPGDGCKICGFSPSPAERGGAA